MPWVESRSPSFRARHDLQDEQDAAAVLDLLEQTRERLGSAFPKLPGEVAVVLHGSNLQLLLAQPYLPLARLQTAPAARRYLAGWFARREVHVLAPRLLAARASAVPGSREMLMLTPATLYAHLVVAANNPALPPPFTPRSFMVGRRWAWLAAGSAHWFSGHTAHARPAIARRLREGGKPAFPPGTRDATLLGGTVFDLLAREEGVPAAVRLACELHPGGPRAALLEAFRGRSLVHTEGAWRSHLARLAGP